ncbi:hypothetical protein NK55_06105 [Thermosynechococcus sp. NK55a]|uniref:TIGR04255 family protein n=1 Tax=Thermosynechococcus sp. NK55a TaxID=1394889 RepID=UPI0003D8A2DF|nr:TIGR04255 family protein [Thermosynechococcus sp. NK55a]AHB88526.1 hypothetical protein NK55_06105 [Thermosynechococcus sp. NK55a]
MANKIPNKIPKKLRKEPLLEAVWEIRFTGRKPSVAELLPGLVFQALPNKYPNIVRLPSADIPAPIVEHDPKLRYVPKIRLEGGNQAVQIGEHVVSLSCRRPYSGWKTFSKGIRTVITIIRDTGLIDRLERFSLKYIDLIELNQPPSLSCLNLEIKMGGYKIDTRPVQLRTEIKEGDIIHIIQIVSPAEASIPGEPGRLLGVLLDIDSIRTMKENESWPDVESHLDDVHLSSKKMFFGLLTPETIAKLEPEYEEGQS